jgi:type IV pilus assembly protein PilA
VAVVDFFGLPAATYVAMKRPRLAAFTLIELMMVAAIIGILATIAIPSYARFACRARQSEAKAMLKEIYVAQESYRSEFDIYGSEPVIIGAILAGELQRYRYSMADYTTTTFVALAEGVDGGQQDGDLWSIDQNNIPLNENDSCASE